MLKTKNKYFLINLGCKVNLCEIASISSDLKTNGFFLTNNINHANIVIINTCSVTAKADAKARNMINRAINAKLKPIVIVMGCYSQQIKKFSQQKKIAIMLGNQYKAKVVSLLKKFLKSKKPINLVKDISSCNKYENMSLPTYINHTRAFLKIQDGCNLMCSYCLIPYLRGRECSKKHELVLKEIKQLVRNNFKEIILTGINLGSYKDNNYLFYDLLNNINKLPGDFRLRISSIGPQYLSKKIINLIIKNPHRFCQHLHLSLQAANNYVLKTMHRRYMIEEVLMLVKYIRTNNPTFAITTDYIVGFPTENQKTFNDALKNLKKIKFSWMNIFPFSRRPMTVANTIYKFDVANSTIKKWIKILTNLNYECNFKFKQSLLGKKTKLIVQRVKNGFCFGYTSEFIFLKIKNKLAKRNDWIELKYTKENLRLDHRSKQQE